MWFISRNSFKINHKKLFFNIFMKMEYLSQPFKLNDSGVESNITLSMRLIFMKVCDNDDATNFQTNDKKIETDKVYTKCDMML